MRAFAGWRFAYPACVMPAIPAPPPCKIPYAERTKAPQEGALVYSRSLSFSLSRWFTGGFPPTSAPLVSSKFGEVPVCADTLILPRPGYFASAAERFLAEIFSRCCSIFYSYK